ncbi:MAG: WGR domain-containing protein [Rubrivivax sp.]
MWLTDTRYYFLHVQRDLFGEWELLKVWGGRRSRRGRHQVVCVAREDQALGLFERECQRRIRRGYLRTAG